MMGSPPDEEGRFEDETQHHEIITDAFFMGRTVVTQKQWREVMGTEPWSGKNYVKEGDKYPATYVSWNDAVAFCKKLSAMEGKTYRLPTEAEWEYACRAGSKTAFSFGDDAEQLGLYAWFEGNANNIGESYVHEVAQKRANAFGLYDMHGNVWEWCSDLYGVYPSTPPLDDMWSKGRPQRTARGGEWYARSRDVRCASRGGNHAESHSPDVGFRIVMETV
jgi:formylglycine-generating enzyme required for sulfatase activity